MQVELAFFRRQPAPALAVARGGCGELLADDAERQELVALQAQDRLQPLDVLLAEEPVAALRPPRREQALILEVADLRDGDVRELVFQHPADGPDRQQPGFRRGRHQRPKKVNRYLPICSSSPSSSCADSTRLRLTNVPLRLPWSSMKKSPSRSRRIACLRDTVTSSRKMPQSGERPTVVSPSSGNISPALPPPDRTTSAGPCTPMLSSASAGVSSVSSAVKVCVVSAPPSSLTSRAPQRAQ